MDETLVSIITPTYNCGKFISETIDSVIAQTYTKWEMIIFDDCSTDDTAEKVKHYAEIDKRIHYIKSEQNLGAAITRNNAIKMAKGRWIAFLDRDDLWRHEMLERQLKFMNENNYHFSYHEYVEIDENSNEIGTYISGIKKVGKFSMLCCCWPGCLSVMYDAKVVGCPQIVDVKKNNDTAMWLQIVKKAKCYLLKDNLAYYRRRKGSITPLSIKSKIEWHYKLFRAIGKDCLLSFLLTCLNIFGNGYKKIFYAKKYKVE